MTWYFYYLFIF